MPRCKAGKECTDPNLELNALCNVCGCEVHVVCCEQQNNPDDGFVCKSCSASAHKSINWDECLLPHNSLEVGRLENPYTRYTNRTSIYWKLYHTFVKDHPANIEEGVAGHACCNLCGRCVKVNGGSTSSLKQHSRSNHGDIFNYMMETKHEQIQKEEPIENTDTSQPHPSVSADRLVSPYGPNSSRSSVFWKFFHVFGKSEINFKEDVVGAACCNICGRVIKLGAGSTSPLQFHLSIHHKAQFESLNYQRKPKPPKRESASVPSRPLKYQKTIKPEKQKHLRDIHRSIAIWCIQNKIPLDVVEDGYFRNVLKAVRTSYPLVTENDLVYRSNTMQSQGVEFQVKELARCTRAHVREVLANKSFVCSTYHWFSRGGKNFAILFANYVENMKVYRIAIEVLPFSHVEEVYSDRSWGKHGQIPFAITDTEMKSNKFGTMLEELPGTIQIPSIAYELDQLANIAFQSRFFGDDQNEDDSPVLRKARDLASFLCHTPGLPAALRDAQVRSQTADSPEAMLTAIEDSTVSWLSTYNMAARLLKWRQSIGLLVTSRTIPSSKALTNLEWLSLSDLVTVLKPFAQVVKSLKGAKFVSVSMIPFLLPKLRVDIEKILSSTDGMIVNRDIVAEMLHAFDHRFGDLESPMLDPPSGLHKSIYFALLLDPRFKTLNGIKMSDEQKEKMWSALEAEMRENELAFRQAKVSTPLVARAQLETITDDVKSTPTKRKRADSEDDEDYLLKHFGRMQEEDEKNEGQSEDSKQEATPVVEESIELSIKADCAREIAVYREEKGLKIINRDNGEYSDPFGGWWSDRHKSCPILWRLAQIYLSVPALTDCHALNTSSPYPVPTSIDSTGGKIEPKLIEDIVYVKVNSKQMNLDMMKMS